jgi:hypothetical protein
MSLLLLLPPACWPVSCRARSWADLLPKLPFLTDAAVGALLDLLILAQFFIYRNADEEDKGAADSSSSGSSGGGKVQGKTSSLPRILCRAGSLSSGGSSGKLDVKQQQPVLMSDLLGSPDADGRTVAVPSVPVPVPLHSSSGGALSLPGLADAALADAALADVAMSGPPLAVVGLEELLDAPADVLLLQEGGAGPGSELEEGQAGSWTDSLISIATI